MQEIFQLNDYVHFGAIVNISHHQDNQKKVLCSDGISIRSLLSLTDTDKQVDIATSLFKIQTHVKFPLNNEVDNVLKQKYKKTKVHEEQKKATIGIIDEFEFELTENTDIIEKMKKTPIKYGQEFMLQHVYSCKYLTFKKESQDSSSYFFELTEVPNKNSCFSFSACYHYQDQISQYIRFGSQLYFNIKIESEIDSRIATLNFKKGNVLEEWEISFEDKVSVTVELYQTAEEENPNFIYYGCSLWVLHLETNSFLKFEANSQESDNFFLNKIKYSLKLNEERDKTEMSAKSDVILQKTQNQVSAQTIGLWKIQNTNRFKGGKIRFDDQITFYNVRYKVYLSVEKIVNRRQVSFRLTVEKQNTQNTHFKIKGLSTNSQYVTNTDLIVIQHSSSKCYLSVELDSKKQNKLYKVALTNNYKNEDNFRFTTIGFMADWENNFILSVLPFIEEGTHLLQKDSKALSQSEYSLLLFVRDNLLEIMNFSEDLSQSFEMSESKLGKISFKHYTVQKLLREQGFLNLLPQLLNQISPARLKTVNTVKKKQQLMQRISKLYPVASEQQKQQRVLKLIDQSITSAHFRLFGLGLIMSDTTGTNYPVLEQTLDSIVRIIFRTLRNATKSNDTSSKVLWLKIESTIKFLGYKCGAEQFFISLFSNNPKLLDQENLFLPQIIQQYAKMQKSSEVYFPEVFKLLNSFMHRDDEGINNTQMKIYELMIKDRSTLLIPIECKGNKLMIRHGRSTYELSEINRHFSQDEGLMKTLANQFEFYTYLCYGRNYVCSRYVKSIFHFDVLFDYLNGDISNDLKASLLLIIIRCYLDERPRFRENLPSLIYNLKSKKRDRPQYTSKKSEEVFDMVRINNPYKIEEKIVRELLDCVSLDDSMTQDQIVEIKKWTLKSIENFLKTQQTEEFYDRLNEVNLNCLKIMIQLKMFTSSQSEKIQQIIFEIINKLKTSMEHKGEEIDIQSDDFNKVLEEMLAKDILKKFNSRNMFDGVEDEINSTNITLRFIKYAYYQNLFLVKNLNKNKNNLILNILELINDSLKLVLDNKLHNMIELVRTFSENPIAEDNFNRTEEIQKIMLEDFFRQNPSEEIYVMSMIQSLMLIFFDSNNYNINHKALYSTLMLIYDRPLLLQTLKQTIIIGNQNEERVMDMIRQNYFEVKLLVETSEVWLHETYDQPKYVYTPIIHYVVDKINSISNIIIHADIDNTQVSLTAKIQRSELRKRSNIEKQLIVMNTGHYKEILSFLTMSLHLFSKITRTNHPGYAMFESCFMFLYVYIYECKEAKNSIKEYLSDIVHLIKIGKIEMGQTAILVSFLENNYEENLDFCENYLEEFMNLIIKEHRYISVYGRLIRTILSHYNEPLLDNLSRVFSSLFEIEVFRKFLWVTPNTLQNSKQFPQFSGFGTHIFQLDKTLVTHEFSEPYLYQAEALDVVIFLMDNLEECRNIFKTHIKSTFKFQYLYYLLSKRDYYTDETSSNNTLKLHLILKVKILKLIDRVYLNDIQNKQVEEKLKIFLEGQLKLYAMFVKEFPSRKQTLDFRKPLISRLRRQDESKEYIHKFYGPKIKDMYSNEMDLLKLWRDSMLIFVGSVDKAMGLYQHKSLTGKIKMEIEELNYYLFEPKESEEKMEMSYEWLIQGKGKNEQDKKIKNICSAWILECISSEKLAMNAEEYKNKIIRQVAKKITDLGISRFDFIRKIAELIEDSLEKLKAEESNKEIERSLRYILRFLRDALISSPKENQDELRLLLAKSQIIFPLLNYFQQCKLTKQNKRLFKIFIEFLNELLGEEGNKDIQNVLFRYFDNKDKSTEIFHKIKKIIQLINSQKRIDLKSKIVANAMRDLKQVVKHEQPFQNVLFTFLTLFCKGNNSQTQLFLTRLNRKSSFDVIKLVLSILKDQSVESAPLINKKNYKLIMQSFSIIRELIEGPCNENQDYFLNSAFFDISLKYFRFSNSQNIKSDYMTPREVNLVIKKIGLVSVSYAEKLDSILNQQYNYDEWMISQIKFKCISTIGSLLEENISDQAINKLVVSIPKQEIINNIDLTYQRYVDLELEYTPINLELNENKELILPLGFKLYFILQYYVEKNIEFDKDIESLQFFDEHTRTIEIVHNKLFTLRFPLPPVYISEAFKKQFLETADRTSINSKLKDLQETEIQNRRNSIPYVLLVMLLTLNLLDLVSLDATSLLYVDGFRFVFRGSGFLINVDSRAAAAKTAAIFFVIVSLITSLFLVVYQWTGAVYMITEIKRLFNKKMTHWQRFVKLCKLIRNNMSYFHYLLTSLVLFLSLFNPFFDSIVMIIEMFKQLQMFLEIGRAIKQSFLQLMVVVLIYILSVYAFVIVIYFAYANKFQPCTGTLYSCLCFGLDISLKQDPGILGYNDDDILNSYQDYGIQNMLFDIVMLFVLVVIVEQVLGAIIVDKFAQIREENEKREMDEETKCYICGLDVELLDREQDGFEVHKQKYHNLWNYFQFLIYLKNSKLKDLSGIELFVNRCKQNGDLRWFPMNRSLTLENRRKKTMIKTFNEQVDEEDVEEKIMDEEIEKISKIIKQLNEVVGKITPNEQDAS